MGAIVYFYGAGPVGLACAALCHILGAAVVIVGDVISERLAQAESFGCETIDRRNKASLAHQITGEPLVDSAVDCVAFETCEHGSAASAEQPATVLNSIIEITRTDGSLGMAKLYVPDDPGRTDTALRSARWASASESVGHNRVRFTTANVPRFATIDD